MATKLFLTGYETAFTIDQEIADVVAAIEAAKTVVVLPYKVYGKDGASPYAFSLGKIVYLEGR